MPKVKAGHLEIAVPTALSRTVLTPPEGVAAFGVAPIGATPTPSVAWAQQIFSFLDKAARTSPGQRSASHLMPYARDLAHWIEQFCEFFGPLTVQIRPFSFLVEAESVFQDHHCEGIASRFFQGGIVALTWSPGITPNEMLAFLQIVLPLPLDDDEPDLVVRLWQAGFAHLSIDLYDRPPEPPAEVILERERIVEALQTEMQIDPIRGINFRGLTGAVESNPGATNTSVPFDGATRTHEQTSSLQTQLASEEVSLALRSSEFFVLLLTQLNHQRDLEQFERWLLPVAASLQIKQEFHALSFLIDDLLHMGQAVRPALAKAYQSMQAKLLHQLSGPEQLAPIAELLNAPNGLSDERLGGLRAFFVALGERLPERFASVSRNSEQLLEWVLGGDRR